MRLLQTFPAIHLIKRLYCQRELQKEILSEMSHSRFFKNVQIDYSNNPKSVEINSDEYKKWISVLSQEIEHNFKPVESNGDGGLYVGTAGIAYYFYYLSKSKEFSLKESHNFLKISREYLDAALKYAKTRESLRSEKSSFLLGNAGVYALAAVIHRKLNNKPETEKYCKLFAAAADNCKPKSFLRCGSDEMFVGRAGYICGTLWLAKEINVDCVISQRNLFDLCDITVKSGVEYSKLHHHKSPLMYAYYNTEYLGAAHGLCFILLMLMSVPKYLDSRPNEAELVRKTVDYFLEIQTPSGNFPCAVDEIHSGERPPSEELVHWCHGAPGVIYTLAKAYLLWKDVKYLKACVKCSDLVWKKGLLKKGPGLCHGIAGNGYVFLLMYRLTNDTKYLHRAIQFAEFMKTETFKKGARTPDSPYSLYEGVAGTACFLSDLLEPKTAIFPFMDIFP